MLIFSQVAVIGSAGIVNDVAVIDATGRDSFHALILDSVKKWRFTPRVVDGVVQASEVLKTIHFDYDGSRLNRFGIN